MLSPARPRGLAPRIRCRGASTSGARRSRSSRWRPSGCCWRWRQPPPVPRHRRRRGPCQRGRGGRPGAKVIPPEPGFTVTPGDPGRIAQAGQWHKSVADSLSEHAGTIRSVAEATLPVWQGEAASAYGQLAEGMAFGYQVAATKSADAAGVYRGLARELERCQQEGQRALSQAAHWCDQVTSDFAKVTTAKTKVATAQTDVQIAQSQLGAATVSPGDAARSAGGGATEAADEGDPHLPGQSAHGCGRGSVGRDRAAGVALPRRRRIGARIGAGARPVARLLVALGGATGTRSRSCAGSSRRSARPGAPPLTTTSPSTGRGGAAAGTPTARPIRNRSARTGRYRERDGYRYQFHHGDPVDRRAVA